MRQTAYYVVISLAAGLAVPALVALWFAAFEARPLTRDEWKLAFLFFGPFTVTGALAVVTPAYVLQRNHGSEWKRTIVVLVISTIAGIVMLLPLSEQVPWTGAGFALATAALWLTFNWLGKRLSHGYSNRSGPSG